MGILYPLPPCMSFSCVRAALGGSYLSIHPDSGNGDDIAFTELSSRSISALPRVSCLPFPSKASDFLLSSVGGHTAAIGIWNCTSNQPSVDLAK